MPSLARGGARGGSRGVARGGCPRSGPQCHAESPAVYARGVARGVACGVACGVSRGVAHEEMTHGRTGAVSAWKLVASPPGSHASPVSVIATILTYLEGHEGTMRG